MGRTRNYETEYPPEEAAKRRDEVIRRMANTPPQPKINPSQKKEKPTDAGRAARKDHVSRER
jgi:hypothetical protein